MAERTTKKTGKKTTAKRKAAKTSGSGKKSAPRATKKVPARRSPAKTPAANVSSGASAAERIDAMIADLADWRGERLAEIRSIIHEADRDVVEEWKWRGAPVWSHDGMYAVANAHKNKVKLTFFHGAQLRDPKKLFNAGLDGNKWRAIDLHEDDRIDRAALTALLREAVQYNVTHAVPKSRGSRA